MKIYHFERGGKDGYGFLEGELLRVARGSIAAGFEPGAETVPIGEVRLLAPSVPTKIVAVGVNYKAHALERGRGLPAEPLLFLKPPSALIGPGEAIVHPRASSRVDYEGELALVIGRRASRLGDGDPVEDYSLGYTCFNDVTARDLQDKDVQFTRAKSFDTFAAAGPCIAVGLDSGRLALKTFVNGKLRQSGHTSDLIFPVPVLVRFISRVMTLYPGDLITTGTPSGIGPLRPGDRVDAQIEGIGTLSNHVIMEEGG
ncbi:MAG: fumarylacetoacetate hydrolase family protein [Candidatus Aminicenantes bacterium]|nr:fumarylacetoacetate hydrolase family protein [Candidatus Aminicenantes bacterium]